MHPATGRPLNPAEPAEPTVIPTASPPANPADELLDIVDEHDRVVGQARRGEAYARGLRHRCVFVQARDAEGRVFVHRRTPGKLVFPAMYDMFVGGVVGAGESYDDAALREAEEELGVTGLPRPVPLFRFLYRPDGEAAGGGPERGEGRANGGGRAPAGGAEGSAAPALGGGWWSAVYEVRCDLPVHPQVEEVDWYGFLTDAEIRRRLGEWPWVPDGLAAHLRLEEFRSLRPG